MNFTVQTVISPVGNIFPQCFLKRSGLILFSAELLPSDSAFFSWTFTVFHVSIFLLCTEILLVSTVSLLPMFSLPLSCRGLGCTVFYSSTFFLIKTKSRAHSWTLPKYTDRSQILDTQHCRLQRRQIGSQRLKCHLEVSLSWIKASAGKLLPCGSIKHMILRGSNSGLDMILFVVHLSSHIHGDTQAQEMRSQ